MIPRRAKLPAETLLNNFLAPLKFAMNVRLRFAGIAVCIIEIDARILSRTCRELRMCHACHHFDSIPVLGS